MEPNPETPKQSWMLVSQPDVYCSNCEDDIRPGDMAFVLNGEYAYDAKCAKSIYGKTPPNTSRTEKRPPPFV